MKAVLGSCAALLLVLAVAPAQAQDSLVLYDDFEDEFIDRNRWVGFERGRIGGDSVREIHGPPGSRRLHLLGRVQGDLLALPLAPGFSQQNDNRLRLEFANPAAVTAIRATATIKKVEVTTCPGSIAHSRARLRVADGNFFNAATPSPGSDANNVTAEFFIERRSDSADPPGVLRVGGVVFFCGNTTCQDGTTLFFGDFGTLALGVPTTLRLEWDPDNNRFIFQRDAGPEVFAFYSVSDTAPPSFHVKDIALAPRVANCTGTPRSSAFMEAFIDNVFVNAPAP